MKQAKVRIKLLILLLSLVVPYLYGQDTTEEIVMRTNAKIGDEIRIQTTPYNAAEISGGVEKGDFLGIYKVIDPSKDIVIKGPVNELECYKCNLTSLTIVKGDGLKILKCYANNLSTLDVSNCEKLFQLDCHSNQIEKLLLNTQLEKLNCSQNKIKELDLSKNIHLDKVECGNNELKNIDIKNCTKLTDFSVENNKISNIDLSKNTKLWWVKLHGNKIAEYMDDVIANLPTMTNQTGMLYIVNTRDLNEGNKCYVKHVNQAMNKGWVVCDYLDGIDTGDMFGSFYKGFDYIPTYGKQLTIIETDKNVGDKITLEIKGASDIDIQGVKEKAPYNGKQTYTLSSKKLSIKGDYKELNCPNASITSLLFPEGSQTLTGLDCSKNKIKNLDVSNIKTLENLKCQENLIESLNVAGCSVLHRIDCYRNNLRGCFMDLFIGSLPEDKRNDNPLVFIVDSKAPDTSPEKNECYLTHVKQAKEKGWRVKDYINGGMYGMGQDFDGEEQQLPKEYFEINRKDLDHISITVEMTKKGEMPIVDGGETTSWNGETIIFKMLKNNIKIYSDVKSIKAYLSNIESIDVSNEPNLEELYCGFNNLEYLDLSHNKNLRLLSCESNKLVKLNIQGTPIGFINCYGNKLVGENMTEMISALPKMNSNDKGTLIVVDTKYVDEKGVSKEFNKCLKSDVEAAKDKNWVVYDLNGDPKSMIEYRGFDYIPDSSNEIAPESQIVEYYYDINGVAYKVPQKGVNIIKMKNGVTKKILIK